MANIKYVCTECGNDEILFDAFAEWDEVPQKMVLQNTFDETYCTKCDGPCKTDEVPA